MEHNKPPQEDASLEQVSLTISRRIHYPSGKQTFNRTYYSIINKVRPAINDGGNTTKEAISIKKSDGRQQRKSRRLIKKYTQMPLFPETK